MYGSHDKQTFLVTNPESFSAFLVISIFDTWDRLTMRMLFGGAVSPDQLPVKEQSMYM